jgi:hypothetical protein
MTAPPSPSIALPPALPGLLRDAHARLRTRIEQLAPALSTALLPWMEARAARGAPPEHYFTHPMAFPLVLLPWWLDETMGGSVDASLQSDLLYSSMSGYYVIRLIDDVMDESDAVAARLLPAVCVLHAEFQSSYARRFSADHPFWIGFHEAWASGSDAALAETLLPSVDEESFVRISARKVSASIIPMRAVAWHHGVGDLPGPWASLFPVLCSFHQRYNDLFDWQRDLEAGARTWFLCEAERRRHGDESVSAWVAREGFELCMSRLESDLAQLDAFALATGCTALRQYLEVRRAILDDAATNARAGLAALGPLLAAFTGSGQGPR